MHLMATLNVLSGSCRLIKLACDDTAASGNSGTSGRRGAAAHSLAILIQVPLGVRARDETTLGIPAGDPVEAVVEKEETQLLGPGALVQRSREPAAALFEFRLEHVSVEDAAVDKSSRELFVLIGIVAADEMPAAAWEELVRSRDGTFPVLLSVDLAVDAITALEPVDRAADGAQTEEEVGGHCWLWRYNYSQETRESKSRLTRPRGGKCIKKAEGGYGNNAEEQ